MPRTKAHDPHGAVNPFLTKKAEGLSRDEHSIFDELAKSPDQEADFATLQAKLHISNERVLRAAASLARRELASLWGSSMRLEHGALARVRASRKHVTVPPRGVRMPRMDQPRIKREIDAYLAQMKALRARKPALSRHNTPAEIAERARIDQEIRRLEGEVSQRRPGPPSYPSGTGIWKVLDD